LTWGIGIGPLPNLPWPSPIHIRFGQPITFDRYGKDASNDETYIEQCYQQTHHQMQRELDDLLNRL